VVNDFDIADLRRRGFVGFVPVERLTDQPPAESGVYAVVREATAAPRFLDRSDASWFKGKDPTVSIARLEAEWVADVPTVYLGKADSLSERIGLLVEFSNAGRYRSVFHWGGRLCWQLDGCQELLVAWKVEPDFAGVEADLLDEFIAAHGRLPFANLKRERRKTTQSC
jgi:hypothetical protein